MKDHITLLLAAALIPPVCATADEKQLATQYSYLCEGGVTLEAAYLNSTSIPVTADISVAGKNYQLQQGLAASGTKYMAGDVVWWTKGRKGFLQVGGQIKQENCVLVSE